MVKFVVPNFSTILPFVQINLPENKTNVSEPLAEYITKLHEKKHHNKLSKRLRKGKRLFRA